MYTFCCRGYFLTAQILMTVKSKLLTWDGSRWGLDVDPEILRKRGGPVNVCNFLGTIKLVYKERFDVIL